MFAALVFLGLALTEEFVAQQHTPMNARVIAACVARLLAVPWDGVAVGVGSTFIALGFQPDPPAGFGLATVLGGLASGLFAARRPRLALAPAAGMAVVGHTSQQSGEVLDLGFVVCIDTDCVRNGWLTALDVDTNQVWQADRAGRLRNGNTGQGGRST